MSEEYNVNIKQKQSQLPKQQIKKDKKSELLKDFIEKLNVIPSKDLPKDVIVILSMMQEIGIEQTEPQAVFALLDFVQKRVSDILENARIFANHAKKKHIDVDDIKLANEFLSDLSFVKPPARDVLAEIATKTNSVPLPVPKTCFGLRIPPDRYCLTNSVNKMKSSELLQMVDVSENHYETMITDEEPIINTY